MCELGNSTDRGSSVYIIYIITVFLFSYEMAEKMRADVMQSIQVTSSTTPYSDPIIILLPCGLYRTTSVHSCS